MLCQFWCDLNLHFQVYTTPTLCMSAQVNAAALPNGAIPMAAVTPFAGLIRWCALAPLYVDEGKMIIKNINLCLLNSFTEF